MVGNRSGSPGRGEKSVAPIVHSTFVGAVLHDEPVSPYPALKPGELSEIGCAEDTRNGRSGWRAQARYRDTEGNLRPIEASGRTKKIAVQNLRERFDARMSNNTVSGVLTTRSTVAEAIEAYFLVLALRNRPQTIEDYRRLVRVHVVEGARRSRSGGTTPVAGTQKLLGGDRISKVTTARVEAFLDALHRAVPSQAKILQSILRGAFDNAIRLGVLEENPVLKGKGSRTSKSTAVRDKRFATMEEIERFRAAAREHARDPRAAQYLDDLAGLLQSTGLRIGEALALQKDSLVRTGKGRDATTILEIRATMIVLDGGLVRQGVPKSAASNRDILPDDDAIDILTALIKQAEERKPFEPSATSARRRTRIALDANGERMRQPTGRMVRNKQGKEVPEMEYVRVALPSQPKLRRDGTVVERRPVDLDALFVSRVGSALSVEQALRAWRVVADAAGLNEPGKPPFTPHAIRRSLATILARRHGIDAAAAFMGHTRGTSTTSYIDRGAISTQDMRRATGSLRPEKDIWDLFKDVPEATIGTLGDDLDDDD